MIIDWCLQCYSFDSGSDSTWHAQNESMDSTWYAQNESTWHARYISALWAARVMLTPFPLTRLLPQAQHEELFALMLKDRKSGREAQGVAYFLAMIFKRSDFNGDLGKIHEVRQADVPALLSISPRSRSTWCKSSNTPQFPFCAPTCHCSRQPP